MKEDEAESENLRFVIRLMIIHPRMDPEDISKELELVGKIQWQAGLPRSTPKGTPLPGVYKDTRWGWSERHDNQRAFFSAVVDLIAKLERHRDYFAMIAREGGTIDIILHLPGDANIGSSIAPGELRRLADLNIGLGIEVFPDFP